MLLLMVTSVAFGQGGCRGPIKNLRAAILNIFNQQYPGVTAQWYRCSGGGRVIRRATFKTGNVETEVSYDKAGKVFQIRKQMSATDLPADAITYLEKNYKGKLTNAMQVTDAKGNIIYYAGGYKFDSNGKVIK